MLRHSKLIVALLLTGGVALWGLLDVRSLVETAEQAVAEQFDSRAWFIMLAVSFLLIVSIALALSPYGRIKLGRDEDEPEFSTISWLTMLFAAGMGVGLLYYGTAEPLTHFSLIQKAESRRAADGALFITNMHWGLHAWAIYGLTGLVIAYFSFRRGLPTLVGQPMLDQIGRNRATEFAAWAFDILAIVAIAIGLGGSVAMGVFQVKEGVDALLGGEPSGTAMVWTIFALLVAAYILPLTVDLSKGMALLSNTAMALAGGLMVFVLLAGPTNFLMGSIVQGFGDYVANVLPHGFRTFTFMDESVADWFQGWTLNYMVWWLAWAPFVGVFIARISRGRTIRAFLVGVLLGPTGFSIVWFGVFGGIGFYAELRTEHPLAEVAAQNASAVTFLVLERFPASTLTIAAVVVAAFLFVVTSVVSAAFVLGMYSSGGSLNPSARIKLAWGGILGALAAVMILSGDVDEIRSVIALGALPFVFIVLLLVVCLLRALRDEEGKNHG